MSTDTLLRSDALPQVDLLPPEVRAGRRLGALRGWLALGLVAVLALCAAGWGTVLVQQRHAEDDLAVVEARSAELIAQQQQFAEVPQVLAQIRALDEARLEVAGAEVLWRPYLDAIAATAPEGVSIDSLTAAVNSPLETDPAADATTASPGTIVFTARSRTLPDTATWVEQLAALPGLSNPWFSSASITEAEGVVFYTVTVSVDIDDAAFAHRFSDDEEG